MSRLHHEVASPRSANGHAFGQARIVALGRFPVLPVDGVGAPPSASARRGSIRVRREPGPRLVRQELQPRAAEADREGAGVRPAGDRAVGGVPAGSVERSRPPERPGAEEVAPELVAHCPAPCLGYSLSGSASSVGTAALSVSLPCMSMDCHFVVSALPAASRPANVRPSLRGRETWPTDWNESSTRDAGRRRLVWLSGEPGPACRPCERSALPAAAQSPAGLSEGGGPGR
jgi:hypothetical protein